MSKILYAILLILACGGCASLPSVDNDCRGVEGVGTLHFYLDADGRIYDHDFLSEKVTRLDVGDSSDSHLYSKIISFKKKDDEFEKFPGMKDVEGVGALRFPADLSRNGKYFVASLFDDSDVKSYVGISNKILIRSYDGSDWGGDVLVTLPRNVSYLAWSPKGDKIAVLETEWDTFPRSPFSALVGIFGHTIQYHSFWVTIVSREGRSLCRVKVLDKEVISLRTIVWLDY